MPLIQGEPITLVEVLGGYTHVAQGRAHRGSFGEWVLATDGWAIMPWLRPGEENIRWRRGHVDVSDLVAAAKLEESAREP